MGFPKLKMEIGDFQIEKSTCKKLLGAHFDIRLTFDYNISGLQKATASRNSQKATEIKSKKLKLVKKLIH